MNNKVGHRVQALFRIYLILALVLMARTAQSSEGEISEVVLQTIAMESASEPFEGQVAVARVLLNRAYKRGSTPEIEAKRPWQFSCWNGKGAWARVWLGKHYTPIVRLRALKAYKKAILDGVSDVRHYHTVGVSPSWARGASPKFRVGNHLFYEGIK